MGINSKKLMEALTQRGAASLAGGALYGFVEPYVPIDNHYARFGLLAALGALAPELAPKSKMLDYAGAGIVGSAACDLTRIVMNSDRTTTTTTTTPVAGLGSAEPIYNIDEDQMAGVGAKVDENLA